jgi:hypothetical protein
MSGFNLEKGADRRRGLRASDTPDKGRMTRPLNKTQQAQAEGRRSRREVLNYLLECLTSPANPATAEQITEFKMTSFYFPEIKQAIEKVEQVFADKEDLRRGIMLAAAYEIIERLIR